MNLGFGVLLVLAALTFLLAAILQCLSLRKQEDLIERLERMQGLRGPHARWHDEAPTHWRTDEGISSSHVASRRRG